MTETAQGRSDDDEARAEGQADAVPPLPGPADETSGPMTIIPGPAAEDTVAWQPAAPTPARFDDGRPAPYPAAAAPAMSITGFLSDIKRTGRWQVPAALTVTQGLGDVTLDLREAVITSPVVEVTFYGGMSSLKIIVPPGVEVEWGGGMALLSDEKADPPGERDPSMWRLRVTHYGLMSEVRVRTLAAGETPTKKWWKGLR